MNAYIKRVTVTNDIIFRPHLSTCITMIGNSLVDYIIIRLSITLLRLIAPTSIGYLVLSFFRPKYFVIPIGVVAAAEASFYLLVYLPRRRRLQVVRLSFFFFPRVHRSLFILFYLF